MRYSARSARSIALVSVVAMVAASTATAQPDPLDPFGFGVELVGVAVDLDDGETIGDCRWYETRSPGRVCAVNVATFEQEGVPIVEGRAVSLTEGQFGSARYRVGGRVTHLHYQKSRGEQTLNSGPLPAPVEPRIATDGRPLPPGPPAERIYNRVRIPARGASVTATVEWTMYDSVREEVVATDEVKSVSPELGVTIYDSYVDFLEARKDDLADR